MKINPPLSLILLVVFFATTIHAQFKLPKYKDVAEMKNRQLVVIINSPDPDIVNKYDKKGKPEVVQQYEQIIGDYNDNMKYLVKKFWTFNTNEILFKTWDELKEILHDKSQRDKYFVISCFSLERQDRFAWTINKGGERIVGTHTYIGVCFPDETPLAHFHLQFSGLLPTVDEMAFFISSINYDFNYVLNHKDKADMKVMADDNAPILSKKTLLILKSAVSPKVINDINTYYPCNYRLVEDSVMQQAIVSGDPDYAYVIQNGAEAAYTMNWVVNCEDGAILGYSDRDVGNTQFTTDQGYKKPFFQEIGAFCGAGIKK